LSVLDGLRAGSSLDDIVTRLEALTGASLSVVRRDVESSIESFVGSGLLESTSTSKRLRVPRTVIDQLRMVSASALHEYLVNTALWREYGNAPFAALVTDSNARAKASRRDVDLTSSIHDHVLYHAWSPGFVHLEPQEARSLASALDVMMKPSSRR